MWQNFIAPETLLEQVWNTAPFLRERRFEPPPGKLHQLRDFLAILFAGERNNDSASTPEEQLLDYFVQNAWSKTQELPSVETTGLREVGTALRLFHHELAVPCWSRTMTACARYST